MQAVLVERTYAQDAHLHLVEPIGPLAVRQGAREAIAAGRQVRFQFPACAAVMDLYGGAPGQEYGLACGLLVEGAPDQLLAARRLTWGATPSHRHVVNFDEKIVVIPSDAIREAVFKIELDGVGAHRITLPILWR